MMKNLILLIVISAMTGCGNIKNAPSTLGDPQNALNFGYQPIDPLPVQITEVVQSEDAETKDINLNSKLMETLPDETMRLAIGEIDSKGDISFASAKMGYSGKSYIVILDYIKFDTKSLKVQFARNESNEVVDFQTVADDKSFDGIIPMYVGVGLRLTATIKVNEGKVDLGNLFALGLAAESKKVTGTLVIQTLGISGKDISSLIPMPSQINTTTIQTAIMSLASIKAKIYEDEIQLNPRVVGFYNNIGGGQNTVHKFISNVLSKGVQHYVYLN